MTRWTAEMQWSSPKDRGVRMARCAIQRHQHNRHQFGHTLWSDNPLRPCITPEDAEMDEFKLGHAWLLGRYGWRQRLPALIHLRCQQRLMCGLEWGGRSGRERVGAMRVGEGGQKNMKQQQPKSQDEPAGSARGGCEMRSVVLSGGVKLVMHQH